ncbi:MAG: electron transfer flavoprotein subunit beta/FixA family protein [Deltaproteobacteria bacterium]|nr:electron transfer flavoprotein subunit beta/FixA family protein [Deltaproteobacteria bacterium]MBW2308810.1 electron transfer flavoprotein subunit beta/FixA family protein [Deltaproteobacteria bacterium]
MDFRIIVCVKPVPDPKHWDKMALDPETRILRRQGIPMVINPLDKHALEMGLRLREAWGGHLTVAAMAPPESRPLLLETLAMGADEALLLSDPHFRGSDTLVTARILAAGIRAGGGADFVLTGQNSIDGSTGQVGPQLAHFLEMASIGHIREIKPVSPGIIHVRGGPPDYQALMEIKAPVLLSVMKEVGIPRFISMTGILQAEDRPIRVLSAQDLDLARTALGLEGSPTRVSDIFMPEIKRRREILRGEPDEAVQNLLQKLREAGIRFE